MATRFYTFPRPSSGLLFSVPSFSIDAGWHGTGQDYYSSLLMHKRWLPSSSGMWSVFNNKNGTTNPFDACGGQFISLPLEAQTIAGTVKGVFSVRETDASYDMRAQLVIRVIGPTGTVRGTLLGFDTSALTSEFSTTQTNRKFPLAWAGAGATLSSVVALAGDRIVAEIGFRAHNGVSGAQYALMWFGTNTSGDCAENETDTTSLTGWLEFSQTLSFAQDGGLVAYHGNLEDLISQVGSPRAENLSRGKYSNVSVTRRSQTNTDRRCIRRPSFGLGVDNGAGFIAPSGTSITYIKRARDLGSGPPAVYTQWTSTDIDSVPPTSPPVGPWGEIKVIGHM